MRTIPKEPLAAQLDGCTGTAGEDSSALTNGQACARLPLILMVDDQAEVCHVLSLLAGDQYQCIEACSGASALRILNDADVDVIVSDVQMPEMNGVEFLRRAQVIRPNAARVLISGFSKAENIIEGINKGQVNFYLSKPFDQMAMQAMLQQAVQHSRLLRDRSRLVEELTCLNRDLEQRVIERTAEVELKNFELERTTQELKRAAIEQASLVAAVEQAADAIVITDTNGSIRYANPAFTTMTGYTREEAVGNNPRILKSGCESAAFYQNLWSTVKSGVVWHGEMTNRRKDGSLYSEEMRITPVQTVSGEIDSYIAIKQDVTARRETEKAHAFLAAIVENCEDSIISCTPEGIIVTFNRGAEACLGFSAQEAIGKHLSMLVPPDRLVTLDHLMRAVRIGQKFSFYQGQCQRKDGCRIHTSVTAFPLLDPDGEVVATSYILRDVTERRIAEQALRDSREFAQSTIDALSSHICVLDETGTIIAVNQAWKDFALENSRSGAGDSAVKFHREKFGVGSNYLGVCDNAIGHEAAEAREFAAGIRAVLRGEIARYSQDSSCHSESQQRWFMGGVTRFLVNQSPRMVVEHINISERRQAEEAVRSSEARLRGITDSAHDAILMMDPRGCISFWNPAAESILGYRREEAVGRDLHDLLMPQQYLEAHGVAFREFQKTGKGNALGKTVELLARHKSGREITIDLSLSAMCVQGEWHAIAVVRDISERKRAEQILIKAREGADAANVAKSRFLANMSHEIRTPMNGVIGMIQLLLETNLTTEQQGFANVARSSGRVLLALIDQVLDLSKIEAGKLELENVSFELKQIIDGAVEPLRVQAGAKGLDISTSVSPSVPPLLRGDSHRLRQVLTNLIANAVKFTPKGRVELAVAVVAQENARATIRFRVADTGIGIPEGKLATLFSPFTQADESTTRKYGGTGLGLAICKQLVELMGGQIGFESREGEGATFWFTVPLEVVHGLDNTKLNDGSTRPLFPKRSAPSVISKREARILVAEDNVTNRIVVLAQLKKLGYQADAVANGAEAVKALEQRPYSLILMDCEMPVMDGYEATGYIRKMQNSQVPIIALTANAMSDDRERCFKEGMNDFLSKPVDLERLADVLAQWCPDAACDVVIDTVEPSATEDSVPVFDSASLLSRLMGDRQLGCAVIDGFLADVPIQLQHLRQRVAEGDGRGARLVAHRIKGSAATVSADRLSAVALEIERKSRAGEMECIKELLSEADEELNRFKSTLVQTGWL